MDVCLRDEEVTVNLNLLGELGINLGDCFNLDIVKSMWFFVFESVSTRFHSSFWVEELKTTFSEMIQK